nr:purine/pyrimidine permease [Paenibacillus protaetiae]
MPFGTFASSIGFLENTKVLRRAALLAGSSMLIIAGIFPVMSGSLAQLPLPVGGAVLFAAYLQMFGTAFRTLQGTTFQSKTIYRMALPALTGISIMNIPASAFGQIPPLLVPILSNGLIIGVILVILLENLIRWDRFDPAVPASSAAPSAIPSPAPAMPAPAAAPASPAAYRQPNNETALSSSKCR